MSRDIEPRLFPLKEIVNPLGNVYHALKKTDASFTSFGEAYFTTIKEKSIKGWKKHTVMDMNLIVPAGNVTFFVYNEYIDKLWSFKIGTDNYCRLYVPSDLWVAFRGESNIAALILNIASIEHDPQEAINVPLNSFSIYP